MCVRERKRQTDRLKERETEEEYAAGEELNVSQATFCHTKGPGNIKELKIYSSRNYMFLNFHSNPYCLKQYKFKVFLLFSILTLFFIKIILVLGKKESNTGKLTNTDSFPSSSGYIVISFNCFCT